MSTDGALPPSFTPPPTPGLRPTSGSFTLAWTGMVLAAVGLGSSVLLWQKVDGMQEQLARQTAESGTQATEARAVARESQDLVREAAGRLSVLEARVQEATLQRSQLEDLLHSVSRSRDETLLMDVESALRIALQQAQFSGSLEPLTVTLKSSAQRIERAAQPRLAPVHRAMEQDLERLARANVMDTAGLLGRLDELVRIVDDMPLLSSMPIAQTLGGTNASGGIPQSHALDAAITPTQWAWWQHWSARIWGASVDEARDLVRVRRIDHPEAMLLAPDQAFFLRENLKLKLLNARLGLLARQHESARADLGAASAAVAKYFNTQSRRTQSAQSLLLQIQTHLRQTEQPTLNDTLSALATAAAGR